ncbi:transketolase C-terminal domain-containing protein [Novosphingobium sp.]|uniref:alpha-ketoacid dehydrogenase subunit beta n=1 Tax=Novosphingobium sp. TaxID=1874826 RepID=UPI00260754F9|nr:transketolase C-terminal domain-containing protein [Novosphingobium sp.]
MAEKTYLEAIRDALFEEMGRDPAVFIMGEDARCNFFGTTSGIIEAYGLDRILDCPIAEAGITGVAAGAAMVGMRPVVDFTIAPFLYPAMDQICSIVAKSRYLYGGQAKVPLVLRANMIYGSGGAAQHSDRPYPMFMHMPGLKIMVPSSPYEAKGLLKTAIRDDDPVLSFEDANLWSAKSEIPDEDYTIPFGQAALCRRGVDCTVVAIGAMVPMVLEAAAALAAEGIDVEVIDPRTLAPLDMPSILESVARTGRLVVVDVAWERCSAADHIAAVVSEEGFWDLSAPIMKVCTENTHIPFNTAVERALYPSRDRVIAAVRKTFA